LSEVKHYKIKEEWLWCDECKKTVKAYTIDCPEEEGEPARWIFINPHEHVLRIGACPRTVWATADFKEQKFPELTELFKALGEKAPLEKILKVLETLGKLGEKWERAEAK